MIFSFVFSPTLENQIFIPLSAYLNFDEKWFLIIVANHKKLFKLISLSRSISYHSRGIMARIRFNTLFDLEGVKIERWLFLNMPKYLFKLMKHLPKSIIFSCVFGGPKAFIVIFFFIKCCSSTWSQSTSYSAVTFAQEYNEFTRSTSHIIPDTRLMT